THPVPNAGPNGQVGSVEPHQDPGAARTARQQRTDPRGAASRAARHHQGAGATGASRSTDAPLPPRATSAMIDPRRNLPSVSNLLEQDGVRALFQSAPRSVVVSAVRATINDARAGSSVPRSDTEWAAAVAAALERAQQSSLRRVINATGVVLHPNFGRAPLAQAAIEAMQLAADGYTNLEYDMERGSRGSRYTHC